MARGWLTREKWHVEDDGSGGCFNAERFVNGKRESWYGTAHCLACAKTEVLTRRGGKVDLRGWHNYQGMCGSFLVATQKAIDEEVDG